MQCIVMYSVALCVLSVLMHMILWSITKTSIQILMHNRYAQKLSIMLKRWFFKGMTSPFLSVFGITSCELKKNKEKKKDQNTN